MYIAVDFFRREILYEAHSHAELNQTILSNLNENKLNHRALRIYQIPENVLRDVKQQMQTERVPFYEVAQPK